MLIVLLTALGVGGATVIGSLFGFVFKNISHKFSDIVLSFAAGVMLAAAVVGLVLPSLNYGGKFSLLVTIAGVFVGALCVNMIDKTVPHLHRLTGTDLETHPEKNEQLNKVLLFVIAIAIHNLPEGIEAGVGYVSLSKKLRVTRISDLCDADSDEMSRIKDGTAVKLLAIVTGIKKKTTKSDTTMAFVTVEDLYGSIELLVFPKLYAQFSHLLMTGNILFIEGRVSLREEESTKVIPDRVSPCPNEETLSGNAPKNAQPSAQSQGMQTQIPNQIQTGLMLLVDTVDSEQDRKVKNLLSIFEGNIPVYLYYNDTRKKYVSARGVDVNTPMLDELKRLLGERGVMLK